MASEFDNHQLLVGYSSGLVYTAQLPAAAIQRAVALYRSVHNAAIIGKFIASLRRKDNQLLNLPELRSADNTFSLGVQPVAILKIRGSVGRCCDFDTSFRPIGEHTRDRWVRIATLIYLGTYLPAVELIQAGDCYFVSDGNHRVSVFRAMGVNFIDAHVTVLAHVPSYVTQRCQES